MNLTDVYAIKDRTEESRNKNDFYPTAPIATVALLKNHNVPNYIWEPAAGRGHISKVLQDHGRAVHSTDLYSYEKPLVAIRSGVDFLTSERLDVQGVITNPPYRGNLPEKLIRRMLEVHKYSFLALFCRLTFMESARRHSLFKEHPPKAVYVMSERIQCDESRFDLNNGIGGMVAYAWFVWDKRFDDLDTPKKTRLEWVRPSDYIGELKNARS